MSDIAAQANVIAQTTDWPHLLNWMNTLFQLIISCGVIFAAFHLRESKKQASEHHESKRRENAIKFLEQWHSSNDSGIRFIARKLVKELPRTSKVSLMKMQPFEIDNNIKFLVELSVCNRIMPCSKDCKSNCSAFDTKTFENSDCKEKIHRIILSQKSVAILRHIVISYLNGLENIASAYKHNIADRYMLSEQFVYLVKDEENFLSMLNEFGMSDSFPCIFFFITDMQKKTSEGKAPLG